MRVGDAVSFGIEQNATRCACPDWAKGIADIDSKIGFLALTRGWKYEAPAFRFCPWCGTELPPTPTEREK